MKIAILLIGAIGKTNGHYDCNSCIDVDKLSHIPYIDYKKCNETFQKHVIEYNKNHHIDTYIHSWSFDIADEIISLYKPKSWSFDNNLDYKQLLDSYAINTDVTKKGKYSQLSYALSVKKVTELMISQNVEYDLIMYYRLDLILYENMKFSEYNIDKYIYNNNMIDDNNHGEFFFIMSYGNAVKFKELLNSSKYNRPSWHRWIQIYIQSFAILKQDPNISHDINIYLYRNLLENNRIN